MRNLIFVFALCFSLVSCFGGSKIAKLNPKEELGKALYFDKRLSVDGTVSCNDCHMVSAGGTDNRRVSMGITGLLGDRNAPTVFNAKFLTVQFWDGRARDLKEQAKGPLTNPIEMGNTTHEEVIERIQRIPGYITMFEKAYGANSLSIDNLADAIAKYEETLTTLNSPYDKFKAGEEKALSLEQKEGMEIFNTVGCTTCHSGDHFAGPLTEIGTGFFQKFPLNDVPEYEKKYQFKEDLGRYKVTKKDADRHFFRVPTLRNIAQTAPYFHNGKVKTLDEAVRIMGKTQLDKDLDSSQVQKIVAFLNALSGEIAPQTIPVLPPTPNTYVVEDSVELTDELILDDADIFEE